MPRKNLETLALGALLIAPLALMLTAPERFGAAECAEAALEGRGEGRGEVVVVLAEELELDGPRMTLPAEELECPLEPTSGAPGDIEGEEPSESGPAPELDDEDLMALRSASGLPLFLARGGDLVLSTFPQTRWGQGAVRGGVDGEVLWAKQSAGRELLPPALQAMYGRQVVVHEVGGGACTAEVGALSLYAERYLEDEWGGELPRTRAARRERALDSISDPLALVGELRGASTCGEGIAWPAEAAPPVVYVKASMTDDEADELRSAVLPHLAAQPEYELLRRAYGEYRRELVGAERAEAGTFSAFVDAHLAAHSWGAQDSARELLIVELRDPWAICGEGFDGRAAWIFEVGDGELRRLHREVDFGITVLLGERGVEDHNGEELRWMIPGEMSDKLTIAGEVDGWEGDVSFEVPYFGCPC